MNGLKAERVTVTSRWKAVEEEVSMHAEAAKWKKVRAEL